MAIISNKVNERQRTDMKKVKIISDSTCDLSKELLEKYDISILPLHIVLGDKEYTDGVDITPEEIYKWSDKNKTTPKKEPPKRNAHNTLKKNQPRRNKQSDHKKY